MSHKWDWNFILNPGEFHPDYKTLPKHFHFLCSAVILEFPTTTLPCCSPAAAHPSQPSVSGDDTESKIKALFLRAYWRLVFCAESLSFSSRFQHAAIYSAMIRKMMTYGEMTLQECTINRHVYSQWWGQDDLTHRTWGCVNVISVSFHIPVPTCVTHSFWHVRWQREHWYPKSEHKNRDDAVLWSVSSEFLL